MGEVYVLDEFLPRDCILKTRLQEATAAKEQLTPKTKMQSLSSFQLHVSAVLSSTSRWGPVLKH